MSGTIELSDDWRGKLGDLKPGDLVTFSIEVFEIENAVYIFDGWEGEKMLIHKVPPEMDTK